MPTQKWQYFAADISMQPDERHPAGVWKASGGNPLSDYLVEMGNDGWEIASSISHDENYYTLIFKRPKPEQPPRPQQQKKPPARPKT